MTPLNPRKSAFENPRSSAGRPTVIGPRMTQIFKRGFLWVGLLLAACGTPPTAAPPALPPFYFDLTRLLDEQRAYLESVSPGVTRTVRADDVPAETQRLTNVAWDRELRFFYDADLNKPALRGLYTTDSVGLPGGGTRRTYRRRPAETAPIREMTVETGPGGAVRLVQAVQDDRNMLFASERRLTLRLDPAPDHNRLLSYEIGGRQKLRFFGETTYEVRAEVE